MGAIRNQTCNLIIDTKIIYEKCIVKALLATLILNEILMQKKLTQKHNKTDTIWNPEHKNTFENSKR